MRLGALRWGTARRAAPPRDPRSEARRSTPREEDGTRPRRYPATRCGSCRAEAVGDSRLRLRGPCTASRASSCAGKRGGHPAAGAVPPPNPAVGSAQVEAPNSDTARSNDASGSGTSSPMASTSGNSSPNSRCISRAVSSCAGVGSTPTAAHQLGELAETYAVPQPSPTTSRPATSPEHVDLRLRNAEDTPEVLFGPCPPRVVARVLRVVPRPDRDVLGDVLGVLRLGIVEPERDLPRRGLG